MSELPQDSATAVVKFRGKPRQHRVMREYFTRDGYRKGADGSWRLSMRVGIAAYSTDTAYFLAATKAAEPGVRFLAEKFGEVESVTWYKTDTPEPMV